MSQIFKKISKWKIYNNTNRRFSTLEFPFKGYNSTWDKNEKVIQTSSLPPEVIESFINGHDYFKTLVSTRILNNLAHITRPVLFSHLKEYYQTLDQYKIDLSLEVEQIAYTSIESIYCFDEYVGVNLNDNIKAEEFRFINMFGKKYFKKYLVLPNQGMIRTFSSFLVLDILFRTQVTINLHQNNKRISEKSLSFEKCMLQFICDKKDRKSPFKVDGTESPWKISNINKWIDESNNRHFFI